MNVRFYSSYNTKTTVALKSRFWLDRFLIFATLLLWLSELFCLCCVAALKSLPALSFNALIFPILRIVCTISFHYSCPWISSMSCILGQVWYLIVSIPDLCNLITLKTLTLRLCRVYVKLLWPSLHNITKYLNDCCSIAHQMEHCFLGITLNLKCEF